ncbi:glycosyltransferase family 4 protein [Candidatus Sumerlaeota bacterium]|nr:glycosyltransferase family 4 protein [Candidatus Sumerlaeota bacterium]
MRFLFINQYYSPDYAATAQQLADLCESLAAKGHDVHVLASRALYDGRDMKLQAYEVINGVHVHRIGLSTNKRDRIRQRLQGYASFYIKAFAKVHLLPRADVVVTLTTPPLISLLGTWLRIVKRSRFVCWVMDVYPDIAIEAGVLHRLGLARGVWSALGRVSYMTANSLVVLGNDMKSVIARKSVSENKIHIIQSWACGDEVHPVPKEDNSFRANHFAEGNFTVMYSGNMGTCHTFDEVIRGIRALKDDKQTQFSFVGGGKQLSRLKEKLSDLPETVKFLPYQDRKALSLSLSAPNVHLITLQSRYDGLLVPSKLYAIMAAARPAIFVGSENNEVARIIREAGCGIIVPEGDCNAFVNAVKQLRDDPAAAERMGQNGRDHFERNFDRKIGVRRFAEMLEREALQPGVRGARRMAHRSLELVVSDTGTASRSRSSHQVSGT